MSNNPNDSDNGREYDQRAPNKGFTLSRGISVGWLRGIAFIILDSGLVSLAWVLAERASSNIEKFEIVESFKLWGNSFGEPGFLLPILIITLSTLSTAGLYGERYKRRQFGQLFKSLSLSQGILVLIAFLNQPGVFTSRSTFLLAWLFSITFVFTGRLIAEEIINKLRQQGAVTRKIFLIGSPKDILIAKIALKLLSNKEFEIVGEVDLSAKENKDSQSQILKEILEKDIGEVFVCSWHLISNQMDFYWNLKTEGIHMRFVPVGLNIAGQIPRIEMIGGMPTIKFAPPAIIGGDFLIKRAFDFSVAMLITILASPLLLIIAIAIKLDDPGPIFFKQTRVGLRGRYFKVWKFRTMIVNAEAKLKELEEKNKIKEKTLFKISRRSSRHQSR